MQYTRSMALFNVLNQRFWWIHRFAFLSLPREFSPIQRKIPEGALAWN
jgi:hypothetical protein